MIEVWKDIVGFEGLYQVSNCGRVKSLSKRIERMSLGYMRYRTAKEKILSIALREGGYCHVSLWLNGTPKNNSVHRLVALAFIDNPENKPHNDRSLYGAKRRNP